VSAGNQNNRLVHGTAQAKVFPGKEKTMKDLIEGIYRSYPPEEAREAVSHIGDVILIPGKRKFLGLTDNVLLLNEDGPYNNVVCYAFFDTFREELDIRFLINGQIKRPMDLLNAENLLEELHAML
jgi:hypothetical protein